MHTALHEELPAVLTMQTWRPAPCKAKCTPTQGKRISYLEVKQLHVQASGAAVHAWTSSLWGLAAFTPSCLKAAFTDMPLTGDQHLCLQAICDYSAMLREVYPGLVLDPHFLSLRSMQEYAHGEHTAPPLQWPAQTDVTGLDKLG